MNNTQQCPHCAAPVQNRLSATQLQFACGTCIRLKLYSVGTDCIKIEGMIHGKCSNHVSVNFGVKEVEK
ncbi:MAG: hypothetical protein WC748_09830 [Legionellales bacterium]